MRNRLTVRYGQTHCGFGGIGILANLSYVTLNANQIHDMSYGSIVIEAGEAKITSNNIQNANFSEYLYYSNNGIITGNTVANSLGASILLQGGSDAKVTGDTLLSAPNSVGIWLFDSSGNSVTGNIVSDARYGVLLQGATNNIVQSNKFSQLGNDGILDMLSLGGNIVTKNTVDEAVYGIFTDGTVSGDTLVPNNLYNTVTTVDPGPVSPPSQPTLPPR